MHVVAIVTGISAGAALISGCCWARAASIPTIQRLNSDRELGPPDPYNARRQIVWNRNAAWFAAATGISQAVAMALNAFS